VPGSSNRPGTRRSIAAPRRLCLACSKLGSRRVYQRDDTETPAGGKLVIADLDIREGRLKDFEVSGDFFLEPPEALSGITGALEDAPAALAE